MWLLPRSYQGYGSRVLLNIWTMGALFWAFHLWWNPLVKLFQAGPLFGRGDCGLRWDCLMHVGEL
jgi:hypothetical protein